MDVGDNISVKGYITQLHFVAKKTGPQLENLIGFKAGRLGLGWAMLHLTKMPKPGDFQFRGYSQMSGGISQGHLKNPIDKRTAEQRLKADEFDVVKLKEMIIKDTFAISGAKRLVKIIPNKKPAGNKDFPPGTGIPQWELVKPMKFKVAAVILPDGVKWVKKT